ncbi:hypothetical protein METBISCDRAFT_6734, partial [Metschnikowia bicuspidata]
SMRETAGAMEFELRKFVGLVVSSSANNPAFSNEFLQETTDLAAQFMCAFSSTLRKLTDLQRHSVAGVADLELCLQMLHISPTDLYQEYMRNKMLPDSVRQRAVPLRREVEHMLDDYYAEKYELDKDDPSLVFYTNEQYEIAALVPLQSKSRSYIPEYFPELPPDFTYRLTNSYMDTITELKKIKMKLFEESRLNEASLYKLIDDDEKRWLEELDEQLGSLSDDDSDHKEDIMSVDGDRASDYFDIVAYAHKKRLALERPFIEFKRRQQLRKQNYYVHLEQKFSCYATQTPAKVDIAQVNSILSDSFRNVIQATRRAECAKQKRLAAEEERQRREQNEKAHCTLEFAFHEGAHSLDESDDNME